MITPTIGRVVWFTPSAGDLDLASSGQPLAAIIAFVHSDRCVNLAVFDANGRAHSRTSITLMQDGDPQPSGHYAEWMPFQKGQAAKTEEAEAKLAKDDGAKATRKQFAPHQQRVIDEKAELDERIAKLAAFICESPLFGRLPLDECDRMRRQYRLMGDLSAVLGERIAAF